jgi:hypothetical protein
MTTVSLDWRLRPRPAALMESRKMKMSELGALKALIALSLGGWGGGSGAGRQVLWLWLGSVLLGEVERLRCCTEQLWRATVEYLPKEGGIGLASEQTSRIPTRHARPLPCPHGIGAICMEVTPTLHHQPPAAHAYPPTHPPTHLSSSAVDPSMRR